MMSTIKIKFKKTESTLRYVFLIFLVLKLTGVIDWSWWYVAMPLYAPYVAGIIGLMFLLPITLWLYYSRRRQLNKLSDSIRSYNKRG